MSQTFFDHPIDDRYTWYSSDGNTKKVIDYILVDQYMQQFIEECKVDTKADFQSDHRLVISKMNTPTTKKARGKFAKTYAPKIKIDPKSLKNTEIKAQFVHAVTNELRKRQQTNEPNKIGANIVESLHAAASATLNIKGRRTANDEIWKNDIILNSILNKRNGLIRNSRGL